MYDIHYSSKFKKDVKRCKKQNKDMDKFKDIHELLINDNDLPLKNKDHELIGNWNGFRECHIEPDWLLIYRRDKKLKILEYARMGSHSDLFD
ncbi:MAG: type II toxin-antitoxin system YafQ family toxin [Candidatus Dadabacteria bacterium]|nr:type II toxin-antitoxin system YafQ family toxin [Candidatus Dadabacteria bacterium]NIS07846.1 type II toxin-antitoxin system YafQ family toxin [Candidatus Dadabacteria bacterium]NIV42818.1 type II toxin-antitoxin system mRNA interferase toxin, RelE/StbE family [Candidatus Dadabacteria bacterium]NIY21634.1 type II toxin-antitoxin system mRNA interferase toxin, RelE/StbE family [Candidatus Dadabacteria bacterium]